ncbi:AAA family ATPase [Actinocrispum sp. NPDC049592]|uniref:helix-turn-helix transcriptional regulator n=1 Tax=Actinocrispum sp. NPDC049592 TaxID=3154835 RepID=UPI003448AA43
MQGPWVGRADEVAAVRAAYSRAPGVVLISGEAGIGKSRLVSTVTASLPGAPLVLSGGCLELGAEGAPYLPFVSVLRDLVRQLGRDRVISLLPPDGSALADWVPGLGPVLAGYSRTRLLVEMLDLVTNLPEPVVLVVEDLHWADAASRELFAYLARNLTGAVFLIGTVRTGELAAEHPNRLLLAELGRRAEVTRVELGPLSSDEVFSLLAGIEGAADRARGQRIHQRSGGNPLFVEALSTAGEDSGDLQSLLLARITSLSADARSVLSALAVAGAELDESSLDTVCGLSGVAELVSRDLVTASSTGYTIRHSLIGEAVYSSLLPAQRRDLHARCAAVSEDGAAARHWTTAGEFSRALPAAWRAAADAARRNAYDSQVHLLELILAHWQPGVLPVDRVEVLEQAAAAAFAAGRSVTGIEHSTAALGELSAEVHPDRVARLLGQRGLQSNRVNGGGLPDLAHALELARSAEVRSWLLSALGFIHVAAYRLPDAGRCAAEAVELACSDGLRARALLVSAAVRGMTGEFAKARAEFALARRLADDEQIHLLTFQWEADAVDRMGQTEEALRLAREGRLAAERLGMGRSRGSMLAAAAAYLLRELGRWDEALRLVDDALADQPPPLYGAYLRAVAAEIVRRQGDATRFDVLMRQLTEYLQHSPGAVDVRAETVLHRIDWALDQGTPEVADQILGSCLDENWPESERLRSLVLGARVQQARRAAAPRNRRLAASISDRLSALTALFPGPASPLHSAYRLTFDALTTTGTLSTWDSAVAAWRALNRPYETAQCLVDAATTALSTNNRPGATTRLHQAHTLASELGATPLLAHIDDLIARSGLTPEVKERNDFGLTARELDVLRVLARGHSNPNIATELFISPNTVATHVARILTKLGAATRTEAVTKARDTGLL